MSSHAANVPSHSYNDSSINMEFSPSPRLPAGWLGGGGVPGSGAGGEEVVGGIGGVPPTGGLHHQQRGGRFQQGGTWDHPHPNEGGHKDNDADGPPVYSVLHTGSVAHNAYEGTTAALEGGRQFGAAPAQAQQELDYLLPFDDWTDMLDDCH